MKKNLLFLIALNAAVFAGGGGSGSPGNSWGGEETYSKYGGKDVKVSTDQNGQDVKMTCKTSVRYKNWFYIIKEFKSGYAETWVTKNNQPYEGAYSTITQFSINKIPNSPVLYLPHKFINSTNAYLKLTLDSVDDTGYIFTKHVTSDGGSKTIIDHLFLWNESIATLFGGQVNYSTNTSN